ncbi:MAG: hypothetical protein M5U18_05095 [Dehalococcoidia bacterium]|nr:hypothetical protein [Dehalococcoidia bacterium]
MLARLNMPVKRPMYFPRSAGGEQVAHCGEDGGEDHAAAETLDRAHPDEHGHVRRGATGRGGNHEDEHAANQEELSAVDVPQFSDQRDDDRRGQHVAGEQPGQQPKATEVGEDAGVAVDTTV